MSHFLKVVFIWSEVWAPIIPLIVLLLKKKQPHFLTPVVLYLWLALFLNLTADIIGDFRHLLPPWLQSNTVLYNIHSVLRFACFSAFFLMLNQPFFVLIKKLLPFMYLIFIIINFSL